MTLSGLWVPPGTKAARGEHRWPPPDVLRLADGRVLRCIGESPTGVRPQDTAKVYRGPHGMTVLVSLDERDEPWGRLLHVSVSVPTGYPDWDTIYAVTRAVFGPDVDAMMPLPREEAFLHGATAGQRAGRERQVFHVVEMPQAWPAEDVS